VSKKKRDDEPVPEKHPRDMTSEEALDHLFHPEIARKARELTRDDEPAEAEDRESE
jgi:hypothetical protein